MKLVLGCASLIIVALISPSLALSQQANPFPEALVKTTHDFGVNNPNVILCMGDSITQGVGYNVPPAETFPARLQGLTGKTVINEGQGGARSSYGVWLINTYLNRYKPGYVTILFGVNDIGEQHIITTRDNLQKMITESKNNSSVPIIATLTPVYGSRGWKARFVAALNEEIRAMALREDIPLADLEKAFDWDQRFFPDGLHPSSAGMEIIAKTFAEAIESFETQGQANESGGGGGCVLHPKPGFNVDLLILFLGGLAFLFCRSIRARSRHSA